MYLFGMEGKGTMCQSTYWLLKCLYTSSIHILLTKQVIWSHLIANGQVSATVPVYKGKRTVEYLKTVLMMTIPSNVFQIKKKKILLGLSKINMLFLDSGCSNDKKTESPADPRPTFNVGK